MQKTLLLAGLAAVATAYQQSTIASWTDNPSNLGSAIVLTPNTVKANPALILALHPCGGTGAQYVTQTSLPASIDTYNYIMLFPTSNVEDGFNCWDCWSSKTNLHDGGGDSESLNGLVQTAVEQYGVDTSKIFLIGASSGAMMTNVMAATYPDVFSAGVAYSGVPAGCWEGATSSTPLAPDQDCPFGVKASTYTQQQWVDLAKAGYPGYTGSYPRMQLVHGTADFAVYISDLYAELEQWSGVEGVTFSKNISNTPITNWKEIVYGDGTKVVGYEVQGGGHIPPFQLGITLDWFGFTGSIGTSPSGSTTTPAATTTTSPGSMTTTTKPPATTTTPAGGSGGGTVAVWGQCGGTGWTGGTACASGSSCVYSNPYYSQCIPS